MKWETVSSRACGDYRIDKVITGYAYARSGNAHNPTPRVRWLVKGANGRMLGWPFHLLREAKEYIEDITELQSQ